MTSAHLDPSERFMFPSLSHYYGDSVRALFVGASVLMILGTPFYTESLTGQAPLIVFGVLILVALAAITNPRTKAIAILNCLTSGIVVVVYGLWALNGYDTDSSLAFVLRGAIALTLLFAFYFSLKTMRAMMMHQVGKNEQALDVEENSHLNEVESDT